MRRGRFVSAGFAAALVSVALLGCATASADPAAERSTRSPSHPATATATPRATTGAGAPAGDASGAVETLQPGDPVAPPVLAPDDASATGSSSTIAPHCIDSQLMLAYIPRPQDSGAGSFYGDLVFTNVAATDCSFDGWPGLIAQNSDSEQLGGPALAEGSSPTLVVLAANGGVGVARLHGTQPGAYNCPATTSTWLRAYISSDGADAGVSVPAVIPVCSDRTSTLGIGPLTAG